MAGFFQGDAFASIQLTRSLLCLPKKFGVIGKELCFFPGMNPVEKCHSGFFRKLGYCFLNFLNGAHSGQTTSILRKFPKIIRADWPDAASRLVMTLPCPLFLH